ncbi:hypothetical protein NHQ30_000937 [Ciborinia camelliae]|nr:hypothetical protein NHQ30_000937 [Ciborinia camelliae]
MDVSIQELPNSNATQYGHFSTSGDPNSNDPLTFKSDTLMNDVLWKVFEPPQELRFDIGDFRGSDKYGIQELDTFLEASILGGAEILKPSGEKLHEAAAQSSNTDKISALKGKTEESSLPRIPIAGPSRPSLINIAYKVLAINGNLQTTTTHEYAPTIEESKQTCVISQQSTHTDVSPDSGYTSAAERYHSSSTPIPRQPYSILSALSWFKKSLKKKTNKDKGKSVMREPIRECVSCLDDFPDHKMVHVKCHEYCKECFERLVTAAMMTETMWPVKCCLNEIPHADVVKNINKKLARDFQMKSLERQVPIEKRIYCIKPNCETWIASKRIDKGLNRASCPTCKTRICTTCRSPWHQNMDCQEDKNVKATVSVAEKQGWNRCYKCKAFVEITGGCRHITCRCKAEWCFICLARWETCQCTKAQYELQQQIQQSREASAFEAQLRTLQTSREGDRVRRAAEEQRIDVQMVEDFERQQAEELGRKAERRAQLDENIRRRREEAIVAEIAHIFEAIREDLQMLHYSQKFRLATRSREEYLVLHERQLEIHSLEFDQSQQIKQLDAEYQKENSTEYKSESLDRQFKSKKSSLVELHRVEIAEAERNLRHAWRDWARRKVAEVKWFEAVITKRETMLQTLETQQYAMATAESEIGSAY